MQYDKLGISDGNLCAAVAHAIVHDAAENGLGTACFPRITAHHIDGRFQIDISTDRKTTSVTVTEGEAIRMVEQLKRLEQADLEIFDQMQEAVAQLEGG